MIRFFCSILVPVFFVISFSACTKIDTTILGGDLVPVVDNINTFADTLDITTTQSVFFPDTTKVGKTDLNVLGIIPADPLLGETKAAIYMQLKPRFYPYYFGKANDTINPALMPGTGFDSVVLCLSYKGFWGDSTVPMSLQVVEVDKNNQLWDSVLQTKDVNFAPRTLGVLGSKTIDVRNIRNLIRYNNRRDSASNQIRIRLTGLEPSLFQCDTSINKRFRNDSLFRLFHNGIGVLAQSGKGLMYISLVDTSTKIEVHYRYKNKGNIDTAYSSLRLSLYGEIDTAGKFTILPSSSANNIVRNRLALPSGSQEILIQGQPGTFADLFVDSLSTYTNRIIHRAVIQMEQIPEDAISDSIFSAPPLLYLDLKDTTVAPKWKPVYFDLNPNTTYDPDYKSGRPFFPTGGVDFSYFGGYIRKKQDLNGRSAVFYEFNISRYLQQLVTKGAPNYHFRLFAPYQVVYPQYYQSYYTYGNRLAYGRVKLAGGAHPTKKMKLVVIHSKIK